MTALEEQTLNNDAQLVEKKKKKSKKSKIVEEVEAVVEPVAATPEESEEGEKKKKKKKKNKGEDAEAMAVEEEPVAAEEAPATEETTEKKKKKKKRSAEETVEEVAEEKAEEKAEEEEPAAKKQKVEEEPATESTASTTVFIGGLPWSATEEDVKEEFGKCGEITNFRMLMDRETGKPKGIAFCTFSNQEGVNKALEYHEQEYGGRWLNVRIAEDNPSKGGKGGDKGKGKGKGKGNVRSEKPEDCKSVIIKNLSYEATEEAVREHFTACGSISNCKILTDRDTGACKGVCFIDFDEESGVDAAIKLSDSSLQGRSIFVDYSGGASKGGDKGKGKDGKGKGKGKDGKGKGKGKDGKGKGKKGKSADPTYAARNGAIQAPTGTSQTFEDSDDE